MSQRKNKTHKIPMRRCIGCMESKDKSELIRIAYYEDELSIDRSGRAKGRGVYLCNNAACFENAKKRNAFQRSFKRTFDRDIIDKLFEELKNE